jgi:hypothetical protein
LGAYRIPLETGLLIPSVKSRYRHVGTAESQWRISPAAGPVIASPLAYFGSIRCLNGQKPDSMSSQLQLRKILPISQTLLAAAFGGWGEWARVTSVYHSWLGWSSDLRFHIWPWPFKFAVIQNTPAFLVGLLLSWPVDSLEPGLPEWVSLLPSLVLVPVLWYLIGAWLDRKEVLKHASGATVYWLWVVFCAITAVSLLVAVGSGWLFGSYTSFLTLGVGCWLALGMAMLIFGIYQKRTRVKLTRDRVTQSQYRKP